MKFVLRHPEFQLTRLMRGVTRKEKDLTKLRKFQLTRLMRGVTLWTIWKKSSIKFQLTRLMRGVTGLFPLPFFCQFIFQLTRLMRGVTFLCKLKSGEPRFQLTRLMRGVTQYKKFARLTLRISTHTPHARRDNPQTVYGEGYLHFNSHASCEA